jgi:hypothetical protein
MKLYSAEPCYGVTNLLFLGYLFAIKKLSPLRNVSWRPDTFGSHQNTFHGAIVMVVEIIDTHRSPVASTILQRAVVIKKVSISMILHDGRPVGNAVAGQLI